MRGGGGEEGEEKTERGGGTYRQEEHLTNYSLATCGRRAVEGGERGIQKPHMCECSIAPCFVEEVDTLNKGLFALLSTMGCVVVMVACV